MRIASIENAHCHSFIWFRHSLITMTFLEALRDEVTQERIESCLLWLLVFVHFYPVVGRRIFNGGSIWDLLKAQIVAAWGYFLLSQLCDAWSEKVNALVPEPYLDEVFHIPQASKYCEGRYYEWDDKITTPPGLYVCPLALISRSLP